jgi:competence protein ComEC
MPLWVMEQGARWILFVAHWIAGLEGAVTAIPVPGPWVLPMLTLGAFWLILWRGWVRWMGAAPVLLAFALWGMAERPHLLVSGDGKLLGLAGPEGRALSAARGGGFAAESWLENDGDLAGQKPAAGRPGFTGPRGERWFQIGGIKAVALSGKGAAAALGPACASGALVILAEVASDVPEGCRLIDAGTLRATGPLAVWIDAGEFRFVPTHTARRRWSAPGEDFALPDLGAEAKAVAGLDQ